MSQAYEEFVSQHKMTGSEKADGYSRSAFIGLTEVERDIVFDCLVSELPWGVKWLFFLDAYKASVVVKEKEAEQRGNCHAHVYLFQKHLVNQCGDIKYQQHMIEDYWNYSNSLKSLVINAIATTPVNNSVISLFREIILSETDGDAIASASVHFLESMGFSYSCENQRRTYHRLMSGLRGKKKNIKLSAIEYLIRNKKISDN